MAITLGTIALPVALVIGNGEVVELGEVDVELTVSKGGALTGGPALDLAVADLLDVAAAKLRKEATDAAAAAG